MLATRGLTIRWQLQYYPLNKKSAICFVGGGQKDLLQNQYRFVVKCLNSHTVNNLEIIMKVKKLVNTGARWDRLGMGGIVLICLYRDVSSNACCHNDTRWQKMNRMMSDQKI